MNSTSIRVVDFFISFIFFLIIYVSTDLYILSKIGIFLFTFFSLKFFNDLGRRIEIRDIMILLALLQWVIGPILAYTFFPEEPIFYMAVEETTYMSYVIPATSALIAGLYLPIFRRFTNEEQVLEQIKEIIKKHPYIDFIILGIGFAAYGALLLGVPPYLRFFLTLLSNARFIGLLFLFLNNRPYKWFIFAGVMLIVLSVSVNTGRFHYLITWMIFMLIVIIFIYKTNFVWKALFLGTLMFSVVIIQAVKYEVRRLSKEEKTIATFSEIAMKQSDADFLLSDYFLAPAVIRINQGWIVSRILHHTPSREPFANGETIIEGLKSSILPRIINPFKAKAGGQENFERFTGTKIGRGTSMDLSIIGEAYANYGVSGGILFMFILGVFYNFVLAKIFQFTYWYPSLLFFLPLLFSEVIKAETDFTSTLNYFIKASIVVWFIFWSIKQFFKIQI